MADFFRSLCFLAVLFLYCLRIISFSSLCFHLCLSTLFHYALFREQELEVLDFAYQVMETDETDADSSS